MARQIELPKINQLVDFQSFKDLEIRQWAEFRRNKDFVIVEDTFNGVLPGASGSLWDLEVETSGNGAASRTSARDKVRIATSTSSPQANDTTVMFAEAGSVLAPSDQDDTLDSYHTFLVNPVGSASVIAVAGIGSYQTTDSLAQYNAGSTPVTLSIGAAGAGLTDADIVRFEYDTALGHTTWHVVFVKEGAFVGRVNTQVPFTSNRRYELTLAIVGGYPTAYINGQKVASFNTTINTASDHIPHLGVTTLNTTGKALGMMGYRLIRQLTASS